jgi:hypothetical protein
VVLGFAFAAIVARVFADWTSREVVNPAIQSFRPSSPGIKVSVEIRDVPGLSEENLDASLLRNLEANMATTMNSEIDAYMGSPGHSSSRPTFTSASSYMQRTGKKLAVIRFHVSDGSELAYVAGLSKDRMALITCSASGRADPLQGKCADKITELFER